MLADIAHQGRTTTVTVIAEPGSICQGLSGTGVARCRPEDVFVPEVGEAIALGRAIQDLGRQVEQDGVECSYSEADLARAFEMLELLGVHITLE